MKYVPGLLAIGLALLILPGSALLAMPTNQAGIDTIARASALVYHYAQR